VKGSRASRIEVRGRVSFGFSIQGSHENKRGPSPRSSCVSGSCKTDVQDEETPADVTADDTGEDTGEDTGDTGDDQFQTPWY